MTKRRPGEHLGGLWEFPGGKIAPGERAGDAARRELREETGLDLPRVAFEPLTFVFHDYGDRRVLLIAFSARADGARAGGPGGPSAESRRDARWVAAEELPFLSMPAANERIVERLLATMIALAGGELRAPGPPGPPGR